MRHPERSRVTSLMADVGPNAFWETKCFYRGCISSAQSQFLVTQLEAHKVCLTFGCVSDMHDGVTQALHL